MSKLSLDLHGADDFSRRHIPINLFVEGKWLDYLIYLIGSRNLKLISHNFKCHLQTLSTQISTNQHETSTRYLLTCLFGAWLLTISFSYFFTQSLTHSVIHSLTHSFTHSLTNPLTHSLTHSPTHPATHLLTHLLTRAIAHSLSHSLMQ